MIRIAVAACALLAMASRGEGRTTQELVADLRTALKDTSASPTDRANEEIIRQLTQSMAPGANGALVSGEVRSTSQILSQIAGQTHSDKVRRLCEQIDLQVRVEKEQRNLELPAKAEDMVKRAGAAVLAAKDPKELDAIVQETNRLMEGPRDSSETGQQIRERLRATNRLVTRWQDYLTQRARGSADMALQDLNIILNDSFALVPRPEIQSRIQALVDAKTAQSEENKSPVAVKEAAILATVKQPSDLAPAVEGLRALRQQFFRETNSAVFQELEQLDLAYKQMRAGLPPTIPLSETNRFHELAMQLYLMALPRFLNVPDDQRPKPDEAAGEYLDRVTAAAKKAGNWPLLLKTLEAPRTLLSGSRPDSSATGAAITALKAFIVAQNNEEAGQYASAVVSYRSALTDVDNIVPLGVVRDRLAAIKQDHVAEYTDGMQRPLPTPVPRYPMGFARDPQTGRPLPYSVPPGATPTAPGNATPLGQTATRPPSASPSPTAARRTPASGQ